MSLPSGTRLGPYEIVAPLGAGGMGEVYRARDTRLDRTVAVKILPSHLSSDPTLRQRFEQEARAISSLNHPHICALYDVGHQDGTDFLIMEYLEGETLAKRLEKGLLPLAHVLKYGVEIADALDKAHRQGIVHRDLKPGNIMLTKSGAKLLDFGLAKAAVPLTTGATLTAGATRTTPVTQQGTIVGTFQYMSPEQIEGKELDGRSDIFSFGAVLYEMVTGRRAFQGKSQLSVASAILEKEPAPISTIQPLTPPALDRAIRRCLAKDPEDRWQTARDLLLELKWIAEDDSQAALTPLGAAKRIGARWQRTLLWGVVSLLLAAITGFAIWNLKPSPPRPITRAVITVAPGQRLAALDQPAVALSPDGTHLVYVATQGGAQQIYLRAMDSLDARLIPGTEGATEPFFSPDGQWLGFFVGNKLKKAPVGGGAVLTLAETTFPGGASWGSQGMIAFAPSWASVLRQMPDAGGKPQPLTRLEKGEFSHRWPEFLPGAKAVLFSTTESSFNWANANVAVETLGTAERRNLVQSATHPRYAASGQLVYVPGGIEEDNQKLVWVTRSGTELLLAAPTHSYTFPRVSPDGRRVAVGIAEREAQLWLHDLSRETLTRFTFEGNRNLNSIWTPDGKGIAYLSNKDGTGNSYWQRADGSGGLERLTSSEYTQVPMSWSPDGQLLAFMENNPTTGYDIWVLRLSDHKAQPFLRTPFNESVPRFSPDGRWLTYVSNESGRYEIYVQPYPGPGGKWQISTEGGTEPTWNPNGSELFYRSGNKMMAVETTTRPSFTASKPRVLFEGRYEPSPATTPNYDVSPDGQRFLMLKPNQQEASAPTQINVVLNWFEELKRRVPTEKK